MVLKLAQFFITNPYMSYKTFFLYFFMGLLILYILGAVILFLLFRSCRRRVKKSIQRTLMNQSYVNLEQIRGLTAINRSLDEIHNEEDPPVMKKELEPQSERAKAIILSIRDEPKRINSLRMLKVLSVLTVIESIFFYIMHFFITGIPVILCAFDHLHIFFAITISFIYVTVVGLYSCLLYTSPSPRDRQKSRMPSSA
eukprot:TRINITY_DN3144_c0_g1_i2.p1 TRINITY_DN3144_c0_g1~~TRINITY_DN3144_c0_g1_i2.p1  ORF type:complete len:198 (+),score=41.20 TRINITY_DN3144_c0_g1_i2:73-666(+)